MDSEKISEWVDLYNRLMSKGTRFDPISVRRFEKIRDILKEYNARFLIAYQNKQPSAIASYILDQDTSLTRIMDFIVSPIFPRGGAELIDRILLDSRRQGIQNVSSWIPLSLSSSIDTLGEYLFNPENGVVTLKKVPSEQPLDIDTDVIDHDTSIKATSNSLPFKEPFKIHALITNMNGIWARTRTYSDANHFSFIDVYRSRKHRREAWIFHDRSFHSPTADLLLSVLSELCRMGIQVVFSEVDIGIEERSGYDGSGFSEISTQFQMTYTLEY